MPKIGGAIKDMPTRIDRGGIPKPAGSDYLSKVSDLPIEPALSMRSSGRDFRVAANASKTSFSGLSGTESNLAKPINRLPKQRPNLIGANKPHMLKNQND